MVHAPKKVENQWPTSYTLGMHHFAVVYPRDRFSTCTGVPRTA